LNETGAVMTLDSAKAYMKDFFERYYKLLHNRDIVFLTLPNVPHEMRADVADSDDEWNVWKLIPSTITNDELDAIEVKYGLKLPIMVRAFLSTYHHLFEDPIGRNGLGSNKLLAFDNTYNPHLTANAFLPFAWDRDNYFIRCIDLTNMPNEDKCPVLEIDHEYMFDVTFAAEDKGEIATRKQLMQYMRPVSDNFKQYLEHVYNNFVDEYGEHKQ